MSQYIISKTLDSTGSQVQRPARTMVRFIKDLGYQRAEVLPRHT